MRIAILGAGNRGTTYASYALVHPETVSVVAIVDPQPQWRHRLASRHGLGAANEFPSWEELFASKVFGQVDAVVNATPDRVHAKTAAAVMEAGLPMLLEKPIAPVREEVLDLADLAGRPGAPPVVVAHVLRYTAFYQALRDVLRTGVVGRVLRVDHQENLWFNHFAHSYVRGNWAVEADSSPFILAKCCHDLDLFVWLFDDQFVAATSVGGLDHFRAQNRPPAAPDRCTDGCEVSCVYDARALYLNKRDAWPANTIAPEPSQAARQAALETGRYGRCVYACNNDVPDRQTASFEMRSGAIMALGISGHHHEETRITTIDGTNGTIWARFGSKPRIEVFGHGKGLIESIDPSKRADQGGHGGGDTGLMRDFVKVVTEPGHKSASGLATAIPSHLAALAAEEARQTGCRVLVEPG